MLLMQARCGRSLGYLLLQQHYVARQTPSKQLHMQVNSCTSCSAQHAKAQSMREACALVAGVEHVREEVEHGVRHQRAKVLPEEHRCVADLRRGCDFMTEMAPVQLMAEYKPALSVLRNGPCN